MGDRVDMIVGQRLRARRRLLGLTQQRLGEACGVTFQQIQKYECAGSRMSLRTLWALACELDVEVSYFFTGLPREGGYSRQRRMIPAAMSASPGY